MPAESQYNCPDVDIVFPDRGRARETRKEGGGDRMGGGGGGGGGGGWGGGGWGGGSGNWGGVYTLPWKRG